jgi:hypothetical protein
MPDPAYIPVDELERYARDELPETFDALATSPLFGAEGIGRRKDVVVWSLWGIPTDDLDQDGLAPTVKQYAGKLLARQLIGPGIDYWSKQVVSQAAGTTEQVSYAADRSEDLRKLDDRLAKEIGDLAIEVGPILPPVSQVPGAAPHVQQAGKLETTSGGTPLYTPDPFDFPPVYGPPDTTTTTAA